MPRGYPNSPKKKNGTQDQNAPIPADFLTPQGQYLVWVETEDIQATNEHAKTLNMNPPFPSVAAKTLQVGDLIYVVYECVDEDSKKIKSCILSEVIYKGQHGTRYRYADISLISRLEKDQKFHDDMPMNEQVFLVKTNRERQLEKEFETYKKAPPLPPGKDPTDAKLETEVVNEIKLVQ
jgi:hypothetical protein